MDQSSEYVREAISKLAKKNIIQRSNGNFNPAQTINHAEMITMIVRALEIDTENLPETTTFKDVPEEHWAFKYVEAAYREGITEGISADEFGKDIKCTREQMAVVIHRLVDNQESILENIIEKVTLQELQHQALYNALVKSQNSYKGEMHTTVNLSIKDSASEESLTISMHEISKVNDIVYSLDMEIEEENVLELNMILTVEYKNIGVEYTITAPEDAILIDFEEDIDFEINE